MTIISDANITSMVRSLIGEATTEYWTDAEVTLYIQFAMMNVMARYWYMLMPSELQVETADLDAATDNIALPTKCAKVVRIEVASSKKMLRKIEADEFWKYSPYDDGSTVSAYFNIYFVEYYDETTDFPEALRPLIAVEAAILAKTKDENVDAGLMALYNRFEESAITFLATDSPQEPTIFGDYEQERAYTNDNPCAWAFKEGKIYLFKVFDEDD